MATSEAEYRRAVNAEIQAKVAAQPMGPVASPSVPYIKFILGDEYVPDKLPPSLRATVYDKELALSNVKEEEILWARMQYLLSEMMFKASRPALACNYQEEITLSVLPAKLLIKLARSRDGGFERRQQTTQTEIKHIETGAPMPAARKSRWRFLGRGAKK